MDKKQIESFVGAAYPGFRDFMRNFIAPLFDGTEIDDWRGAPQMNDDLKGLADRSGVQDIRLCAQVNTGYTTFRVYDVTVKDRVLLKRNRVTVQQLVRKIAAGGNAFMAFHHAKGGGEWRLSFFQGVSGSETSARRHTFLLGPDQNLRTVTDNLLRLRETLVQNGGLEDKDFVRCFDVEALSDEFFDKYKAHYEKFCLYVTEARDAKAKELFRSFGKDGKRVRDYVKKMMGRLVFLQFLQKKGWLGVPVGGTWGEGDRYFLQNLFAKASKRQQEDFLDAVLEPLFFKALNTDRTKRGDVYDTGVKGYGNNGKVRIPYLNGGLFTNDDEDDFKSVFHAALFSDEENRENPDPAKCGVLDFFAQYNFTIDENDPTEAEVGVDPEMLSRIFENLLEDNKDKGAFYTPKPIVDYMCRQSLIAYLQADAPEADKPAIEKFVNTHELVGASVPLARSHAGRVALPDYLLAKLKSVKICDPAIGSGAFPMGLLRELYFCRVALGDPLAERPAELKKDIIENNIYGVDIEKGAVDIARLRFWLSLVVDEETPRALPNLDFKIMQGNSLLESYKGVDMSEIAKDEEDVEVCGVTMKVQHPQRTKFKKLLHEYFDCHELSQKKKLKEQIERSVVNLITENASGSRKLGTGLQEADFKDITVSATDKFFLWHTWFSDVFEQGGFDIVIGNPPYIQLQANGGQLADLYQRSGFSTFERTGDIYCLFYEFGWRILAENGHLCYITSNKWIRGGYGERLRKFFVECTQPLKLLDFAGEKIFESASVDTNILLMAVSLKPPKLGCEGRSESMRLPKATNCLACVATPQCRTDIALFFGNSARMMEFRADDIWRIMSVNEERVFEKICKRGKRLEDWDMQINYGIKTGYNAAFIVGKSVYTQLIGEDCRSAELLLPYVKGQNLERYWVEDSGKWLVAAHNGYDDVRRVDVLHYPAIRRWLDSHEPDLSARTDQGDTPYNLRSCAYWGDFSKPKMLWAETMRIRRKTEERFPRFTYVKEGLVADKTCFFATGENLKYLVAVMNSLLGWYLCRQYVSILDKGGYMMQKAFVEKIPILPATTAQQKPIIALVDKILAAKKGNPAADTSEWEKQIDERVFELYGLNEPEREIIRKSIN